MQLDVDGTGDWNMVKSGDVPTAVRAGDRAPDLPVFGPEGQVHLHDLCRDSFVALHFTDARRRPEIPAPTPALKHYVVSRWDVPHDSGLRDRGLFDPADRLRRRLGVPDDSIVLLQPDAHVAAIAAGADNTTAIADTYRRITGHTRHARVARD